MNLEKEAYEGELENLRWLKAEVVNTLNTDQIAIKLDDLRVIIEELEKMRSSYD